MTDPSVHPSVRPTLAFSFSLSFSLSLSLSLSVVIRSLLLCSGCFYPPSFLLLIPVGAKQRIQLSSAARPYLLFIPSFRPPADSHSLSPSAHPSPRQTSSEEKGKPVKKNKLLGERGTGCRFQPLTPRALLTATTSLHVPLLCSRFFSHTTVWPEAQQRSSLASNLCPSRKVEEQRRSRWRSWWRSWWRSGGGAAGAASLAVVEPVAAFWVLEMRVTNLPNWRAA